MKYKNRYHQLSYRYLAEAKRALKKKKYARASGKLWEASVQMLKAVARKNGWKHKDHRALCDIVIKLSERYNDPDLELLFGLASALHQNFYEDWLSPRHIRWAAGRIKYFVKKVEKLL